MEEPSKFSAQIVFNTRPKIQEHLLIVMDESLHEENLHQPLKANNKHFKLAVTSVTVYSGIIKITNKIKKFYSAMSFFDKDSFIQIFPPPGAYELESSNDEVEIKFIEEDQFCEAD